MLQKPSRPSQLRTNSLKKKLDLAPFVVGTFLEIPSPQLIELLGLAGFDFVVIDCEHGAIDLKDTAQLIRASLSTEISPLVRVPTCEPVAVRQPLDMGAVGIHVPQIGSAAMAQLAVRSAKFFPKGERGLQPFVRAASYHSYSTSDYLNAANEDTAIVLHLEGTRGVSSIDEIFKVEGFDVAFLGPYDLSQSLGIPGQVKDPRILATMREMVQKAQPVGVRIGTYCDDVETALEYRELGVTYLTISIDAFIFLSSARDMVSRLKG